MNKEKADNVLMYVVTRGLAVAVAGAAIFYVVMIFATMGGY